MPPGIYPALFSGAGGISSAAVPDPYAPVDGTMNITGAVEATGRGYFGGGSTGALVGSTAWSNMVSSAASAEWGIGRAGSTSPLDIRGGWADGATSIGVRVAASADLATSGAKILSIGDNAGTSYSEKTYVDKDGGLHWPSAATVTSDNNQLNITSGAGTALYLNESGGTRTVIRGPGGATSGGGEIPCKANITTTAAGNVGAGTDDLISYTLPASVLNLTGRGLRITAWGTAANNANAKTVTFEFGGQQVMTQALTANQASNWRISVLAFRTGSSTQDVFAELIQVGTALIHKQTLTAGTQTESGTIVLKCTGTATTDNDIVQEGLLVEAL
jgi:hypothetical protein